MSSTETFSIILYIIFVHIHIRIYALDKHNKQLERSSVIISVKFSTDIETTIQQLQCWRLIFCFFFAQFSVKQF